MVKRPKQGFSPPDQSWYRGPTMDYIKEIVLSPRAVSRGYFSDRLDRAHACRAFSWSHESPAADLVAALLRVVEQALHRR